ncbi:CEP83 protein, partial [Amia calva]|nr:CEP83 protein [Amia calva]
MAAVSSNPAGMHGSPGIGASDMELQKMLIDERMRCEHHKTNYQTLKAEHTKLQDEFARAQGDLKHLLMEKRTAQEKMQLLFAELRGELLDKTRELEELKMQVLTPPKLELLRAQIQQDLETPMRERFNKLEEEAEKYRSDYNKLRYEYTFLKSEFEHQKAEHAHTLEERNIRFETELSRLEKDKEELSNQLLSTDPTRDTKRVESLLREKAQLHQRLRSLEAEVAELRAERDNSGLQAENVQRIQVRQLAESQAAVKSLEAEKQSLKLQLERLERELQLSHEHNAQLTGKLHKTEREASALTSKVEELKHTHKIEVANIKLECVRSKGEVERERDGLHSQVEGLQADVDILKITVDRNKELLSEKERELVRKVQAAREEELHKLAALQDEKLELESCVAELEQQRASQEAAGNSDREQCQEKLRAAQLSEESARKDAQNLRAKLQQQALQLQDLEKERSENSDLRQQNQELQVQVSALSHSENDLLDTNRRLKELLERLKEELRNARGQAERAQHEAEKLLEDRRIEWLQEKHQLQEQDAQLQEKHSQVKEKLHRAAAAQKKRKTLTESKQKRMQDKIQLLEAKIQELEIENSTLNKKPAYAADQAQLHRRMKELQRRHNEFRRLLLGPTATAAGMTHSAAFLSSTLVPGAEMTFPNLQVSSVFFPVI